MIPVEATRKDPGVLPVTCSANRAIVSASRRPAAPVAQLALPLLAITPRSFPALASLFLQSAIGAAEY